jgi:predicted ATPase
VALGRFNVIIGRNGSGKSTLLESLQWIDTAMRHDVGKASDRYHGVHDVINFRSKAKDRSFAIRLDWMDANAEGVEVTYSVQVRQGRNASTPEIAHEALALAGSLGQHFLISTVQGHRSVQISERFPPTPFGEPDRLALARANGAAGDLADLGPRYLDAVRKFWEGAVFLRLSPSRLAEGSPARRKSFDPLLDEEGQNLPALLGELTRPQRGELIRIVKHILPNMQSVAVSSPRRGLDERVHYSLKEKLPARGRGGRSLVPIPAWMLSEGTRRITAILALLLHEPMPSLLCIEEIENGLDPWTVVEMIGQLRSASDRGAQILLTTHSPWLLDHVEVSNVLSVNRNEGETNYRRFSDREEVQAFLRLDVPPGAIYVREGG